MQQYPTSRTTVFPPYMSTRSVLFQLFTVVSLEVFRLLITTIRPDIVDSANRVDDSKSVDKEYDFIVVGAGAAGCVVANRLSKENDWKVLLLEAGGDEPVLADVPALFPVNMGTEIDWKFVAEPQEHACFAMKGKRAKYPRGKVLGGSTTINGMMYVRGNRKDFDTWESMGNPGWGYEDILPWFKKSEDCRIPEYRNSTYHGIGGYLTVDHFHNYTPLSKVILKAGLELGYPIVDINGKNQRGFTLTHGTVRNGLRCSSAKAFLRPVKHRKNLHVSLRSFVEKVLINERTRQAYGIIYKKNGKLHTVKARKEVILCAGAVHSPMILMHSGIGPKDHLQGLGINVIENLPVGQNLMDHIAVGGMAFLLDKPLGLSGVLNPQLVQDFLFRNKGPLLYPPFECLAFINTQFANDTDYPDIELGFMATCDSIDGGYFAKRNFGLLDKFYLKVFEPIKYKDCYSIYALLLQPESRGYIKLKTNNPHDSPLIYPNYLTKEMDVKRLVEGVKFALNVSQTKALRKYGSRINPNKFLGCEHLKFLSDKYIECCARQYTLSIWHASGTCKMGPPSDSEAVVDANLKVYGIDGLRVVDASIMPTITSGHLAAAVTMIAEKISDSIKRYHKDLN